MEIILLVKLLLAHLLTDFIFQPKKWVEQKQAKLAKSKYFWFHIIIGAALTYMLLQDWCNWWIPLTILISHGAIDIWKLYQEKNINGDTSEKALKKSTNLFFIDQGLHLFVILVIWVITLSKTIDIQTLFFDWTSEHNIIIITAIIALLSPSGIVIGKLTESFRIKFNSKDSLENAGTYIGIFERLLVFIFIIINQFGAVGFLLASKSILRISKDSDEEGRKKTEYVLVGTLISFFIAILIGLTTKWLIKNT